MIRTLLTDAQWAIIALHCLGRGATLDKLVWIRCCLWRLCCGLHAADHTDAIYRDAARRKIDTAGRHDGAHGPRA